MIKFFRKIRQNLLSEGKTGKYIKYAIREIVLVVIGILIALSINNWNEQRKDKIKEQGLLNQLQEDYQSNLLQLEEKMVTREISLNSALQLLNAIDEPVGVVRDSVIKDLANIRHDPTFDPIKNNLTSSENLRLIRNNELRRLLSNWSSDVKWLLVSNRPLILMRWLVLYTNILIDATVQTFNYYNVFKDMGAYVDSNYTDNTSRTFTGRDSEA